MVAPSLSKPIADFCRRWGVAELWLFGSSARNTATPTSDVDILVKFRAESVTSTWDWPQMTDELEAIFGRRVDLLSEGILKNRHRAASILADRVVLYAA